MITETKDERKARLKAVRDAERAKRIEEYAAKVVADAPPLTAEQISLLRALLRVEPKPDCSTDEESQAFEDDFASLREVNRAYKRN